MHEESIKIIYFRMHSKECKQLDMIGRKITGKILIKAAI